MMQIDDGGAVQVGPRDAVFHAVRLRDAKLLRALLNEPGCDPNARDYGVSVLAAVADSGDLKLLRCLLDCPGLDINGFMPAAEEHEARRTVLHLGHAPRFLRRLLRHPAIDVNWRDR